MPTLFIHIGISKTGTKAIQRFCRVNKVVLAQSSYCYPIFPHKYPNIRLEKNAHFLVKFMQMEDGSARDALWHEHMRYIARLFRKYSNVILSDETLWYASRFGRFDMWKRIKGEAEKHGYDIKLIVYLRRQDEHLSSWWAQMLRENLVDASELTWNELITHPDDYYPEDFCEQLDRISAVIGSENIRVRVYDRKCFLDGNLLSDFLDVLGLKMDARFLEPEGDPNISVSGNRLEILRLLSLLPNSKAELWPAVPTAAINCIRACPSAVKPNMYTNQELNSILERYEDSNRRVAKNYLGINAPLFSPPCAQLPPKWSPDNSEMYADIILFFGELMRIQFNQRRISTRLRRKFVMLRNAMHVYADYLRMR